MDDVAIIGGGPYGLSIAAHLAQTQLRLRVFGRPMQTWRNQMPDGMRLKSEGFASTLYDPRGNFPLSKFCQMHGIPYADVGLPVAKQTFVDYGMEFAQRYVPMLEDRNVTAVRPSNAGFELTMADGQTVKARQVVCAVGISHYAYVAPILAALPNTLLSHSSSHHDLTRFAGQTVAVIGGGASATDCAALLASGGAVPHLLTRRPFLGFHEPPRVRSPRERFRSPRTTIGTGWKSILYVRAPLVFHAMPEHLRLQITRTYLGPAPCWFVKEQVEADVHVHTNVQLVGASAQDRQAELTFETPDGPSSLRVDHVIAATGYKVDLSRLPFLDSPTRSRITVAGGAPCLSRWFESTQPGLYFVGVSAANSFGPLLRFACGAQFTARRLTQKFR